MKVLVLPENMIEQVCVVLPYGNTTTQIAPSRLNDGRLVIPSSIRTMTAYAELAGVLAALEEIDIEESDYETI